MNSKSGKIRFGMIALAVAVVVVVAATIIIVKKLTPTGIIPVEPSDDPIEIDERTPAEKIIVDAIKIANSDTRREIDVTFPRITNLTDYAFQEYINDQMRSNVVEYQNEINIIADENTPATVKYRYKANYTKYTSDRYLSILLDQDYQTGGMRSNSWKDTFNIDVVLNREILLKELFDSNVDYQKEIIKEIKSQALLKNYELVDITTIPDKQKFYIKDQKLVIYFDPAAIGPYVYGELHFEMPFTMRDGKFYVQ